MRNEVAAAYLKLLAKNISSGTTTHHKNTRDIAILD